jgi:hypothetical protein
MGRADMRNLLAALAVFWGLQTGLAQNVRLAPGIAVTEAEYRDAVYAWSHADPNLAKDLLSVPPEEMRRRVRRVAGLRDDAMVKKRNYLTDLVARLQRAREQLMGEAPGHIPAEALGRNLADEEAQAESQQEHVEELLRALPPGANSAALRRDLEDEYARLAVLRRDLAARADAFDALERAQQELSSAGGEVDLASKLDGVLQSCEGERDDVERQRADWRELYAAMERAVDANAALAENAPERKATGKRKQTQPPKKATVRKKGTMPAK